jgi:hypothetical protein
VLDPCPRVSGRGVVADIFSYVLGQEVVSYFAFVP